MWRAHTDIRHYIPKVHWVLDCCCRHLRVISLVSFKLFYNVFGRLRFCWCRSRSNGLRRCSGEPAKRIKTDGLFPVLPPHPFVPWLHARTSYIFAIHPTNLSFFNTLQPYVTNSVASLNIFPRRFSVSRENEEPVSLFKLDRRRHWKWSVGNRSPSAT